MSHVVLVKVFVQSSQQNSRLSTNHLELKIERSKATFFPILSLPLMSMSFDFSSLEPLKVRPFLQRPGEQIWIRCCCWSLFAILDANLITGAELNIKVHL